MKKVLPNHFHKNYQSRASVSFMLGGSVEPSKIMSMYICTSYMIDKHFVFYETLVSRLVGLTYWS